MVQSSHMSQHNDSLSLEQTNGLGSTLGFLVVQEHSAQTAGSSLSLTRLVGNVLLEVVIFHGDYVVFVDHDAAHGHSTATPGVGQRGDREARERRGGGGQTGGERRDPRRHGRRVTRHGRRK